MFVPRKFRLRHKLLEILNRKTDNQRYKKQIDEKDWLVKATDLHTELGISYEYYRKLAGLMWDNQEIEFKWNNEIEMVYIKDNGMTAYNEEKYITLAIDRLWKRSEKIIVAFSFAIVFITFILQITSKSDIGMLEKRVRSIEDSLRKSLQPIGIYHGHLHETVS
jgi:hypothetical protein